MSELSVETYTQVLRASGLVKDDQLNKYVKELQQIAPHRALDSKQLSEYLLKNNAITTWHHSKLVKGCSKGFFIGRYKLLAHLGTGGMSRVYLAVHTMMKRQVAIKVLNQKLTESESHLTRFLRESQAAAALDHPNVVRAYDVDCDRNLYYFVMEYVEGPTLQALVEQQGGLDYDYAADYIRQAALGLHHAHEAHLVHRDIKPGNLLVNKQGIVKVLDLGMVRLSAEEVKSITIQFNESMLGTADYLAPEQALDSHNVDRRADIYSLGCTFYFMLTGHPPFNEGSMAMRLMRHQSEEPPAISKDRPDVPEELVRICSKMMAKSVEDRYQTSAEVAADVAKWQSTRRPPVDGTFLPPSLDGRAAEQDTEQKAGPTMTGDPQPARPGVSPAVAASNEPQSSGDVASSTLRARDYNAWKYRDFETAFTDGDPLFVPAVKTLCQKFPNSEKVAAFLVRLISAPEIAEREVSNDSLAVVLSGLGAMNTKVSTKTLMRIVVGSLNLNKNDRAATKLALHTLAEYPTAEREKFLVEVLANAEEARPQGRTAITPGDLRLQVAKALYGRMSSRMRSDLEARLASRTLLPDAQKMIQRLLA
ncbi:MAG TPA: serine/threonine-protein kinase [Pirellulales bacterium]